MLRSLRFKFEQHAPDLPSRPDCVIRSRRLVILVDGDFWHGWCFPAWEHELSPFWRTKISANRARDARSSRKLRRAGWTVPRVWEHQLKRDAASVRDRVLAKLRESAATRAQRRRAFPLGRLVD